MHRALFYPIVVLISYIAYRLILSFLSDRRHAQRARDLGCQPPPTMRCLDPFGFGNIRKIIAADKERRLLDWIIERSEIFNEEEGRVVSTLRTRQPPRKWYFFTTDPKNIQAILASQFNEFAIGEARTANFAAFLGRGIFASDGAEWSHSRALLRPQFSRDQVSDLSVEEIHVQNLFQVINQHVDETTKWTSRLDLQALFFNLTLDSATEFLFGESADSQLALLPNVRSTSKNPVDIDFAKIFDRGQHALAHASRFGDFWWLGHNKALREDAKQVHAYVDYYVRMALDQPVNEKDDGGRYIFLRALAKDTRDPLELRAQLLNILLAGRDTTASLLGYLFILLADLKYADIFKKLRETVIDHFGIYDGTSNITFETLKGCQYLQWCLNETLRLFPVVPINSRRAMVDTTLPRGGGLDGKSPVYVRKGSQVNYSVYAMQRRRDLYGEDAHIFRPERWESRRSGWEYLPFNGGPRICIGQQFALTEAAFVTVRLLQKFDGLEGESMDCVKHNLTLTSCPFGGVNIRLKVAKA